MNILKNNTHHYISLYADNSLLFITNVPETLPHVLSVLDHFCSYSGYKVNKTKSALLPLNDAMRKINLSSLTIPVVHHFRYLGIHSSLQLTVKKNFNQIFTKICDDMRNWSHLPNTLQTRISVVKMNILPRVNFISSMIPLPLSLSLWDKLQSSISAYLWNGKRPQIRLATLQCNKADGGLSRPNFTLHSYSFALHPFFSLAQFRYSNPLAS